VKLRWIAVTAGIVAAAVAASWGMGFLGGRAPPAEVAPLAAATPAPPPAVAKEVAPLRTAAWMLANSRPAPPPTQAAAPRNEDWACGASGTACAHDAVCIDGGCVSTVCAGGGVSGAPCALASGQLGACCKDRCSDLDEDPANCGMCGVACLRGLDCIAGRCLARSCAGRMAGTLCSGPAKGNGACCRDRCIDPSAWTSDVANCGACGHACAPGLTCKQATCIDPITGNPPTWNCGQPAHACPADFFCAMEACYPIACAGDTDGQLCLVADKIMGHCCGQVCADLFSDKNNCRACGVRCPPGELCKNSECVAPDP
jgi:hypothetical protein